MKFIFQQAPATPVTRVSVILPRTGACLDPVDRQGLTRLTTRLMFQGAAGMSNEEINGKLERLGASMGCSVSNDTLAFRLLCLTENLEPAMELFLQSIHQPNLDSEEFHRLQSELISGWIADREESKQLRAQDAYMDTLFGETPAGFMADGKLEGLRTSTIEDVRAHYPVLFSQGDALAAILSDLPESEAERRVYSPLSLPEATNEIAKFPWDEFTPITPNGRRVVILPDKEPNTNEIVAGAFSASEPDGDWHIHRVISFIFGGDMNSRLFRILRGEHGFSYGASCWYESAQGRTPRNMVSPFSLYTFPATEHTAKALPMLLSLYEKLVESGVTEEELDLARKSLTLSHPFLRDTPQKLLAIKIAKELYGILTEEEEENRDKLAEITTADVLRVLQKTHHPDRLSLVLVGEPDQLEPLARELPGVTSVEIRANRMAG